jgi:hypothetical protein
MTNTLITLQIPADKYGAIATESALAGKPIDAYIVDTLDKNNFKPVNENDLARIHQTEKPCKAV